MSVSKPLRAVKPGERRPRKPRSVASAAASGDHRALLVSMRERIALALDNPNCPPRELASLTRRLQDIAKEIGAIDARAEDDIDSAGQASDEPFNPGTI
jgi:hypothetical protein